MMICDAYVFVTCLGGSPSGERAKTCYVYIY
jgi:hypothetical protein